MRPAEPRPWSAPHRLRLEGRPNQLADGSVDTRYSSDTRPNIPRGDCAFSVNSCQTSGETVLVRASVPDTAPARHADRGRRPHPPSSTVPQARRFGTPTRAPVTPDGQDANSPGTSAPSLLNLLTRRDISSTSASGPRPDGTHPPRRATFAHSQGPTGSRRDQISFIRAPRPAKIRSQQTRARLPPAR